MTRTLSIVPLVCVFALAPGPVCAQDKTPMASALMPIKVQVVISRYQGEKKISSLPYVLSITGGGGGVDKALAGPAFMGRANLRMGTKVPVTMMAPPTVDGKQMPAGGPVQYQDVGTNIDCSAQSTDDGRFRLDVSVDDTSVYPDSPSVQAGPSNDKPTFRSFRFNNSLLLKDGQTMQFTAATDKVTGERTMVDVTLNVVK